MREWIDRQHDQRKTDAFPTRLARGTRSRLTTLRTAIGERVRPPESIASEKVLVAIELPSERNLVDEVRGNKKAFQEVAEWLKVEYWESICDNAGRIYAGYQKKLNSGNNKSDGIGAFRSVKVDGRKVIIELVRAKDSRRYPFNIISPTERRKRVSFMGMDYAVATMFETRDGFGPRFTELYAEMPEGDHLIELELYRENNRRRTPFPTDYVFAQLSEDGKSLPVGLTLYGVSRDDAMLYAVRVLTTPEKKGHLPKLAVLSPKRDGDFLSMLDEAKATGKRIGVIVTKTHMPIVRNYLQPKKDLHVVERDEEGKIVRLDGNRVNMVDLPEFANSYYFIVDPVEGEVDEKVKAWRDFLGTESGKRNDDNIAKIIGFDICVTGVTADGLELDRPLLIMPAPLVAVRSLPLDALPETTRKFISSSSRIIFP